ncbi:MAG: DNA primase [Burkholderiaceae bacterium]|nr:DNA primase [Burkholderiaceae bacterium]
MSIPASFIQELLARADVVEIIGRSVQLKKGGANFMGLCPFHAEKSPSFSVSPSKQFFHCFGCGKSGDAIKFLMEHSGMTFMEAVQDLAQQFGMQIPDDGTSPQDKARAAEQRQKHATLSDVLEKAGEAYRKQLRIAPRAVDYLKGRGLSGAIAKQFGLGYAPEGWRSLASIFPDYNDPLLAESGLVITNTDDSSGEEKRYDRFRDRIMFPIRNVKGECIGFGGRVLGDEKPKYLNSPETPVFSKGRELYGLFEARGALREEGYALVTEGYMDVVALAQHGLPNAVATLGTACTNDHVQKLFRFTDTVVFSFDGDAAGRRAAHKALDSALPHATDTRSIKFLFLPTEHDPDSFIRAFGKDAFTRFVADAVPLSRFLIESASEGCDLGTAEGRAHMASNARPRWSTMPDGALKRQLLGDIAELVQLNTRELTDIWSGTSSHGRSDAAGTATGAPRKPRSNYKKESYSRPPDERDGHFGFEGYGYSGGSSGGNGSSSSYGYTRKTRTAPSSRADQAARLLLSHMEFLEDLTHEDHAALCALPAPHGPLFVWLESQFHDYGVQAWAVLRDRLRGQEPESLATRVMSGPQGQTEGELRELKIELRGLLNRILAEVIGLQLKTIAETIPPNPADLKLYPVLLKRLNELQRPLTDISGT